jgi:dienelactone hydrolase
VQLARFVVPTAVAIALLTIIGLPRWARAAEWIELPAEAGQPAVFVSVIKAPSPGRAPVALMLHGGEGLSRDFIAAFETWAQWLGQRGVASVIIDGFRGRGVRGGDEVTGSKYMPLVRGRGINVERTLAWLGTSTWADPARAFIFGQSMGGSVGITVAIERKLAIPQILFYPYCSLAMMAPMQPRAGYPPSLWLIAASDRIALPADTRKCFDRISAAGNPDAIRWVALENTPHMFDRRPNGPGYSGSAVEASKTEIDAFLKARRLMR